MSKAKDPQAPPKGEKAKKARQRAESKRKAQFRSEEFVVESDSDDSKQGSDSGHSSGSESDPEKRKNTKKPNPKKVVATEPADPPVPDSTSEDEEDDDEDEEDDEDVAVNGNKPKTNGEVAKPAVNGKKIDLSDDSSDESTDEDEESDTYEKDGEQKADSDKESEVAEGATTANLKATNKRKRDEAERDGTIAKGVSAKPVAFEPPSGYEEVDWKNADNSSIKSLIPPTGLGSKQIWHITAPSGIPLADIQSFTLANIHQSVINHKGSNYGFVEEKRPSSNDEQLAKKRVLVPSNSGTGYAAIEGPVTRTLHLQQVVTLPELSTAQANPNKGSNAAAEVNKPAVRRIRPQPKGLKMRYKPPGFGEEAPGMIGSGSDDADEDVEMVDAQPAGFRLPKAGAVDAPAETPNKKSRKKDKAKSASKQQPETNGNADVSSTAMDIDNIPPTPSKEARAQALKAETALAEGTRAEVPMSKEEKARLKEEKRERKEEKKAKKEATAL